MNRVYFLMQLTLVSPMSIGSGESNYTDHDIILDSRGNPIIPATAIAGVFSHYLGDNKEELFGCVKGKNESVSSHIKFYDAQELSGTFVTIRDCVALNDGEKTVKNKFDLQAEETGADFEAVIELDDIGCNYCQRVEEAIAALDSGLIGFGAKTSRGYGKVKVKKLQKAEFSLPENADKWLDFNMFNSQDKCYKIIAVSENSDIRYTHISLSLSQNGGISIREYTTERQKDLQDESIAPNFKHITLNNEKHTPVIPGTSWAGAFRSRYSEFAGNEKCEKLFGFVSEENNDSSASRISFSESKIENSIKKLMTRTSIDRFSGGVKNSALFTEQVVFGGECTLDITVKDITNDECSALSAVICDLDRGYLAVGGLASIGRGLFNVDNMTVNGIDVTGAMKHGDVSSMIKG